MRFKNRHFAKFCHFPLDIWRIKPLLVKLMLWLFAWFLYRIMSLFVFLNQRKLVLWFGIHNPRSVKLVILVNHDHVYKSEASLYMCYLYCFIWKWYCLKRFPNTRHTPSPTHPSPLYVTYTPSVSTPITQVFFNSCFDSFTSHW